MSETLKNGHHGESFETEDLSPLGVFYFMAGLAVVGVVIYLIILGMYRFLDNYDRSHQPPVNPMAVTTNVNPKTMTFRDITDQIGKTFPKPVLEYSEQMQFTSEVEKQDKALESYDWVDQKNGVVRIPIERAMDMLVQRGLPVLPQGEAGRGATAVKPGASAKPGANVKSGKTAEPSRK
jgi:hypothetical protein